MICNDLPNFIAYSVKKSKSNNTSVLCVDPTLVGMVQAHLHGKRAKL